MPPTPTAVVIATSVPVWSVLFAAGVVCSLGASAVLVVRLERVGARLGFSEALLGMTAALAANVPEITTASTALVRHQRAVGAGVILGSNAFNVAALIGLGALVAGRVAGHRRVVLLHGSVALVLAGTAVAVVSGVLGVGVGAGLALAVALVSVVVAASPRVLRRAGLPAAMSAWVERAVAVEEMELLPALHPRPATAGDGAVAAVAVAVVLVASMVLERSGTALGGRAGLSDLVTGALVLAVVTSLPNAVAGVYLARRGRATALLSEALNSNNLNILLGLLVPAVVVGIGHQGAASLFTACSALALTAFALALAYIRRGLRRADGVAVVALYGLFAGLVAAGAVR